MKRIYNTMIKHGLLYHFYKPLILDFGDYINALSQKDNDTHHKIMMKMEKGENW